MQPGESDGSFPPQLETHQVRQRVPKLGLELIDKTFDEPVTVDGVVHNLLHGAADGEEVVVFVVLKYSRIGQKNNNDLTSKAK